MAGFIRRNIKRQKKAMIKKSLAKKVANLSSIVRMNKPELKHYDFTSVATAVDNNPTFVLTPSRFITNGTSDYGTRIGDKILQKTLRFKGHVDLASTATAGARIRIFAFIYKRNPDQIVNTWSTVVNTYLNSNNMNISTAPLGFLEWDNAGSFKTLYDKHIVLNLNSSSVSLRKKIDFTVHVPKQCQQVWYSAGSAAPTQNELYIGMIADTDTLVSAVYNCRYYYTDP